MKTMIHIKTDKEVKENAQKIAEELGLPLSTVVNAYLKEFVREKSVRFSTEPQLRKEVEDLIIEAEKDYEKGVNYAGPFKTPEEMDAYLCRTSEVRHGC